MAPKVEERVEVKTTTTDKKMVDKVNQQMANEEDGFMAKIIGFGLIVLGIVFVVLAVIVVLLSRRSPKIDEEMTIPELKAETYTKEDSVYVKGETEPKSEVMFYIDGEEEKVTIKADDEGNFDGYVTLPEEDGKYELRASSVSGFPLRKRSNKSDTVVVIKDTTVPSADVELKFPETTKKDNFTLSGKVEPYAIVKVYDNENEYYTTADKDGNFELDIIDLDKKLNSYTVSITDLAGNETVLDEKIAINYSPDGTVADADGDLNGDGASTSPDLPESAGIFDDAMDTVLGNNLMLLFGIVGIAILALNGGIVYAKLSNKRK